MKVAVISTVGVPSNYGGYETLVENLLTFKCNPAIEYTVYCSAKRYDEQLDTYKGAKLKYLKYDANGKEGLLYDMMSLADAIKDHDVVLSLGTACAPILPIVKMFNKAKIIVNLDGIDTKRAKLSTLSRILLSLNRRTAAKFADICISDNQGIKDFVKETFKRDSALIEYGGDNAFPVEASSELESKYGLTAKGYCFKVARIEAENNIEMILDAFSKLSNEKLVIVGNWNRSEFGRRMKQHYSAYPNILLLDPIYEPNNLNLIRSNCKLYIHGHSVGGTNPSLVEAMNLRLPILAYDVIYNRCTTEDKAIYFSDVPSLVNQLEMISKNPARLDKIADDMYEIARRRYTWEIITSKYENLYEEVLKK